MNDRHQMLAAAAVGERMLDDARRRLGREELTVLPLLDDAYRSFVESGRAARALLCASYAVQAIAAAYADFRQAKLWVARLQQGRSHGAELPAPERLVVAGASVSSAVIVDTGALESPDIMRALEEALQLLALEHDISAADDVVAAGRAILEYCEQQGQSDTFHRVSRTVERYLASPALGPLVAGRYRIYEARCAFRYDAYDPHRPQDAKANALLAEAEKIAADNGLESLRFDVCYARVLLAAIRNETAVVPALVARMHDVLDYTRPNCVALYHQHLARVHLMRDEVAQAFEAAKHALRAAALAECAAGEQRSYQVMHALALLASGQGERAIAEIERMLPAVSGRPQAILECTLRLVEAWHARSIRAADYEARLRQGITAAQELNWPLFLNSLPRIAAQLSADALRLEIGSELVRRAVGLRKLRAPADADDRWPWPIRLYGFGRFLACREQDAISFSGHAYKQAELLKLLMVAGPRGRHLDWFAEMLWPDSDGDMALRNLEVTLARTRKLLDAKHAIVLRNHVLALDPESVWTDVRAFDVAVAHLATIAAAVPAAAETVTAAAERVVELYQGDLLPGDAHAWLLPLRERARRQFVQALDQAGNSLLRLGATADALRLFERGLAADSLAEELFRGVILAERQRGNHAAALQAYRRCVEALSAGLGVAPSQTTSALVESMR